MKKSSFLTIIFIYEFLSDKKKKVNKLETTVFQPKINEFQEKRKRF